MRFKLMTAVSLALSLLITSFSSSLSLGAQPKEDDYDRLDGQGASGARVDVIEWESNLEIHVYPAGLLKGLALKLDKKAGTKDKVMVIGYRFASDARKQLTRRAILGIPFNEKFFAYKDPSTGSEYDKIVISNNQLGKPLALFKLDAEPTQLYPEGHPALNPAVAQEGAAEDRKPSGAKSGHETQAPKTVDEDGAIQFKNF